MPFPPPRRRVPRSVPRSAAALGAAGAFVALHAASAGCGEVTLPPTLDAAGALDAAPLDDARTLDGAPGGEAGACARADVTIPDDAASQQSSGGPAGCTNDEGCAVRYEGDYCACPSTPRPITATRAHTFDESLNGVGLACTCPIPPCAPLPPRRAVCVEGRCALAPATP